MTGLDDSVLEQKKSYDDAGACNFVFSEVGLGSRRGWNFVRDYNDWLSNQNQERRA